MGPVSTPSTNNPTLFSANAPGTRMLVEEYALWHSKYASKSMCMCVLLGHRCRLWGWPCGLQWWRKGDGKLAWGGKNRADWGSAEGIQKQKGWNLLQEICTQYCPLLSQTHNSLCVLRLALSNELGQVGGDPSVIEGLLEGFTHSDRPPP